MRRVPPDMFRFTTGDRAELYGAILRAFGAANERLETALGLDDVRTRLRTVGWLDAIADEDLHEALKQLRQWELLDVVQNHAENYRTAEEYERRNLQYSLTRRGEAAFAGVQHALTVLASTGALQTAVLEAITDRLDELYGLAGEPASVDRRIFSTMQELEGHLEALLDNTKAFNGELQRLLRAEGADLGVFREVKAATVAYLQEFLVNLDQRGHGVAEAVARVEERGVAALQERRCAGRSCRRCPGRIRGRPGWSGGGRAGRGCGRGSCRWTGAGRGWTSCTMSPGGPSSRCFRCSTGSPSRAAGPPAPYRTSGSWRAGSRRPPGKTISTGCGRWPSGSARPATPISRTPTRSWSPRPVRGRRLRRSRCRRCCGRAVVRSVSPVRAGCGTSPPSRPRGRRGPGRSGPNSRRRGGPCGPMAVRSGCPTSGCWTRRPSSGCSICSAGRCRRVRIVRGRGGPGLRTGGWRSP